MLKKIEMVKKQSHAQLIFEAIIGTEIYTRHSLLKFFMCYTVKKPKGFALCSRNLTIPVLKCFFRAVEK